MDMLRDICAKLYNDIFAAGLIVHFRVLRNGEAGSYHAELKLIKIFRPGSRLTDKEIDSESAYQEAIDELSQRTDSQVRFELITLAHEWGHHRSYVAGTSPPSNVSDKFHAGTAAAHEEKLVLREEQRAWNYARRELQRRGFSDWPWFDTCEADALEEYQKRCHYHMYRTPVDDWNDVEVAIRNHVTGPIVREPITD